MSLAPGQSSPSQLQAEPHDAGPSGAGGGGGEGSGGGAAQGGEGRAEEDEVLRKDVAETLSSLRLLSETAKGALLALRPDRRIVTGNVFLPSVMLELGAFAGFIDSDLESMRCAAFQSLIDCLHAVKHSTPRDVLLGHTGRCLQQLLLTMRCIRRTPSWAEFPERGPKRTKLRNLVAMANLGVAATSAALDAVLRSGEEYDLNDAIVGRVIGLLGKVRDIRRRQIIADIDESRWMQECAEEVGSQMMYSDTALYMVRRAGKKDIADEIAEFNEGAEWMLTRLRRQIHLSQAAHHAAPPNPSIETRAPGEISLPLRRPLPELHPRPEASAPVIPPPPGLVRRFVPVQLAPCDPPSVEPYPPPLPQQLPPPLPPMPFDEQSLPSFQPPLLNPPPLLPFDPQGSPPRAAFRSAVPYALYPSGFASQIRTRQPRGYEEPQPAGLRGQPAATAAPPPPPGGPPWPNFIAELGALLAASSSPPQDARPSMPPPFTQNQQNLFGSLLSLAQPGDPQLPAPPRYPPNVFPGAGTVASPRSSQNIPHVPRGVPPWANMPEMRALYEAFCRALEAAALPESGSGPPAEEGGGGGAQ